MKENRFKKTFEITNSMFDKNDYLKFSKILDLTQRVSELHANDFGIGFNDMLQRNLIWVVVRNEISLLKKVKDPVSVDVETFILKQRLFEYPRETHIIHNGEIIAIVRTIWMIIDKNDFSLKADKVYGDTPVYEHPLIEGRILRVEQIEKEKLIKADTIKVKYSQIDHNGHLNNTYYLDFFLDVFKRNNEFKKVTVEYIKQAFLDELIDLYSYEDDKNCYLYGYKENEKIFMIKGEKNEN